MNTTQPTTDPSHFDVRDIPCRVKHAQIFARWLSLPPDHGLEVLRYRLKMSQVDLAAKAGLTQARYSKIEGGADALLSTWRRLYEAMGFRYHRETVVRVIARE